MGLFDFLKKQKKEPITKQIDNPVVAKPTTIQHNIPARKGEVKTSSVSTTIANIEKAKNRFIAIDFETTGLSAYSDKIIEVGAVIFENGTIVNKYESLINPEMVIPLAAQRVNHISNEMVKDAPNESTVIKELVEFIGDAISGNTFLCAHNANFDSSFLAKALERNGYDANLFFLDTLTLSRKAFYFDNYKQETIANHFGIINSDSHRAINDAETCGLIMNNLCDLIIEILQREKANEARAMEIAKLTDEQKEWCAYIQDQIIKNGFDTEFLAFRGQSSNYVSCECIYNFLKIKFGKSKKYIIAKKGKFRKSDYTTEPCTSSEGGEEYLRVIFNDPFEMESFAEYICNEYKKKSSSINRDIKEGILTQKNIEMYTKFTTKINNDEIEPLLDSAKTRMESEKTEKARIELEKEKLQEEKQLKKTQREIENQKKALEVKKPRTRAIIQMNDDGSIVNEFISISEAVSETGINSKSIRDAANGVQKHAGGFCWKYIE